MDMLFFQEKIMSRLVNNIYVVGIFFKKII